MAGPKYRAAFRDVCLKMMRDNGVVFFKFDGMGGGGGTGAAGELADDVDAVLNLTRELRKEDPDLFISATVGTWASPFWTLYADSIWRQGGDTGFHGPGNGRQQWITYRDMFCYRCIVQWGPLYPLNSLMLHGPCIGERTNPAQDGPRREIRRRRDLDLLRFRHEPAGTLHQPAPADADHVGRTGRGGQMVAGQRRRAGRYPLDRRRPGQRRGLRLGVLAAARRDRGPAQSVGQAGHLRVGTGPRPGASRSASDRLPVEVSSPEPADRFSFDAASVEPLRIELQPFEVLVFETTAVPGAKKYDAKAYRQRCAERETSRTNAALVLDPNQGPADAASPINPAELQKLREARWSEDKAWAWYDEVGPIVGCNYLPRTAVNMTEMWQKETFDPKTIDEELGWAEKAGYNSLRVFVQYLVWKDDPEGLKRRMDEFLTIADKHGMRVMLVPFCDCAFAGREPYLGKQDDPVPGVHNSGWVPSPGLKRVVDRAAWPDLERYIKDLVGRFGNDRRVLIWDLYNEPGNSRMGEKSLPLAAAAFRWAREAKPRQPLTIGAWTRLRQPHVEGPDGDVRRRVVPRLRRARRSRRARARSAAHTTGPSSAPNGCTASRATRSRRSCRFSPQDRIGGYHWGLVAGRTQTYMPWGSKPGDPMPEVWQHDVFHADGTPYDAKEFELLRQYREDFPTQMRTLSPRRDRGLFKNTLFNGKDLTGWQTNGNWIVKDGVITLHPREGEKGWQRYDAYLTSEKTYDDFVLEVDFKFEPGGNSGVFLRVGDLKDHVTSGMEIQILDTHHLDKPGNHDCGGIIRTTAPFRNAVKPAGQWNRY